LFVGGGVVTGLALGLFKIFGERWIASKFEQRLEAYRHEHSRDLEQLKFEISKLFDRTTKLHQREFDVLPKAWALIAKSYHLTNQFISPAQSYPDIAKMSPAQFDEFLQDCELRPWEKRAGPDCLNRFSASISGASAGVRLPCGLAAG
jgi:hypothetical protein